MLTSSLLPTSARLAATALAALLAAGCLEFEERIELRPDGAATITLAYVVDEGLAPAQGAAAAAIAEWQGAAAAGRGRPDWIGSEAEARRHFTGDGITLRDYDSRTREGRIRTMVTCEAADAVQALATGKFGTFELVPVADGNWRFRAILPETPDRPPLDDRRTEQIRLLCRGLVLRLRVTTPTKIVAAPGAVVDGKTATWTFDAGADDRFIRTPPKIELLFSGTGLDWARAAAP